jgi:DHA1 family multidrug resistance protein-like MFS transporter
MSDLIRDAPLGQLIRFITRNKYFQYPEEKPGFQLPEAWNIVLNNPDAIIEESSPNTNAVLASSASSTVAATEDPKAKGESDKDKDNEKNDVERGDSQPIRLHRSRSPQETQAYTIDRLEAEEEHDVEKVKSIPVVPKRTRDGSVLVDWYFSDDNENPHNWTNNRRLGVAVIICLYTFVVYTSSAIYTSSTEGVMRAFGVSQLKATLGLSLYVLGYGIGPLIFSPLSEIPRIGRNPVYIVTMFLFVIVSIPTALVKNYPGLMVLRFLQGFFGSPCLASGGASLQDIYSMMSIPYAMMAWVSAAYCGRKSPRPIPHFNTHQLTHIQLLSVLSSVVSPSPSRAGAGLYMRASGPPPLSSFSCFSSSPRPAAPTSCSVALSVCESSQATNDSCLRVRLISVT